MAFAGLWECWTGPNGEELETAAIVTTDANRALGHIHDRMPVILAPDAFDLWLNCAEVDAQTAAALIAPAPDDSVRGLSDFDRGQSRRQRQREIAGAGCSWGRTERRPPRRSPRARPSRLKKDEGQTSLF